MGGGSKGGGGVKIPKPPQIGKTYGQGVNLNLKYLPQQLAGEQAARSQTDAQRVQAQQALQSQFGPTQYAQQLAAFNQLDPAYSSIRGQLAHNVSDQLAQGTHLSPSQTTELQQQVRGAQSARGNAYGDSAGIAEAYTLGDRGQQLYQQRLGNAAGFLGMPTMAQQVGSVAPISPDRSFAYVDPAAGFQGINAANARYQGIVGAQAANQGGSGNSWLSSLGQVAQLAGTVAAFASDRRLKKDIKKVGEGTGGASLYSFAYKGHAGKDAPHYVGYMADEVQESDPGHVATDPVTGYKAVSAKYAPVEV